MSQAGQDAAHDEEMRNEAPIGAARAEQPRDAALVAENPCDDARIAQAVAHYREHGYAQLGRIAPEQTLLAMRERADEIMLGKRTYPGLFFQLDHPEGSYEDLVFGRGYEGPSLAYRKIEKLEKDPLFLAWVQNPVFQRICAQVIGEQITLYRAVLMTKGSQGGTVLPWHQDGGLFWGVDRAPVLQVWTAIDDAGSDAGCVEVVPGSHLEGLATPLGGVVPPNHVARGDAERRAVALPVRAGEVLLLHNHVWHRSLTNRTGRTRRAFSICYMDASTRCTRKKRAPREFFRVF
jgi:phytanoyl-CoA hydroxylase